MASPIILIVEDERPIATLLRGVLQANGYKVLQARNSTTTLRPGLPHQGEIALLLCDAVLRDRCGPDVAGRIRELCPQSESTSYISKPGAARVSAAH